LCAAAVLVALGAWTLTREAARPDLPVIGVSLDTSILNRLGWTSVVYDLAISRAGGYPRSLRPGGTRSAEEVVADLDGLLLTGGGDVDPALYGQPGLPAQLVDRQRDEFELALLRAALARRLPVLGICRGMQLLNVALGGTLRNIRDVAALDDLHGLQVDNVAGHAAGLRPNTRLARIVGKERLRVSSFHGQAADTIGEGLVVAAEAPDGVVEALEQPGEGFVLGVQWHPELASVGDPAGLRLFDALLEAARRAQRQVADRSP